jgi:hypothetical protein
LSCPQNLWPEVSKRFIYYNAEALRGCPAIPWSIPEYLGGAGLAKKEPFSELDRRCATLIIAKMGSDPRYALRKEKKNPLWKVHEIVQKKLDTFEVTDDFLEVRKMVNVNRTSEFFELDHPFFEIEGEFAKLYKYLTVETLFLHSLQELFTEPVKKQKKGRTILQVHKTADLTKHNEWVRKRNNAVWEIARKECFSQVGLKIRSDEELAYEKRDRSMACLASPPQEVKIF